MNEQAGLTRRAALSRAAAGGLALAAPAALAACGGDDSSGSGGSTKNGGSVDIRNQLVWLKDVEFAGYWVADARDYYRQEGVSPVFLAGGPNGPAVAATVAGGAAEIGTTGTLNVFMQAVSQGADLVMWAATYQDAPAGLLSLPKNPVRSAKDLVGKRVGGQQGNQQMLDALLRVNGLKPGSYEFVPVGFTPEPLLRGQCDAYTCYVTNQPVALAQEGIDHLALTYGQMGLPGYGNILLSTRAYVEKNHDKLVSYLRATIKGWERNARDPAYGTKLTVENYGKSLKLDSKSVQAQNVAQLKLVKSGTAAKKGLLWVDSAELEEMYQGLRAAGLKKLPPVDRIFDSSLLEEAFSGKTALLS